MALADDLYIAIRVAAVATSNITIATALNPGDTLNGRTLVAGDLVGVVAQTNAYENGLYRVGTVPTRDTNFNSLVGGGKKGPEGAYDMHPGLILVEEQTGLIYQCTSVRGGTLGTTALTFTRLYASAEDIQDAVGAMFSGNTETNITVTYQDSDGTIDVELNNNITVRQATISQVGLSPAQALLLIDGDAGINHGILYYTASSLRWFVYKSGETESGANAGSNFYIGRYSDAGAFIANAISITRSTGLVTIAAGLEVGGSLGATLTESIQDLVGAMVSGNTETSGISVTYDDTNGKLDFTLNGTNLKTTMGLVTSTTDNAAIRADGTGGNTQNSLFIIDDTGHVSSFGGNIKFPATQVASTDANTLDDYEEGTFTPTVTAASGTFTTVSGSGIYQKVGRWVWVKVEVIITTAGTAAGRIITTLPFTPDQYGVVHAIELQSTLIGGTGWADATTLNIHKYDATTYIASGRTIEADVYFRTAA